MLVQLNTNPSDRQVRQFAGLVVPIAAALIAAILWLKFNQPTGALIVVAVAITASVSGLLRPALLRPVYVAWMVAAYPIGWVVGHLVIGVIFYLVVTPIGLLMRLVGRDPLNRQFDPKSESYWQPRKTQTEEAPNQHFRQF